MIDPVALTADLIRCPSVTPEEGGALDLLQERLSAAGFTCNRVPRGKVDNLFARWGEKGHPRTLGFNGHTDVVPIGDPADWSVDPFGGEIRDGKIWGRGATDMKSGVAAFVAAALETVSETPPDGAIVLAITGDEEGPATDGTVALLEWMETHGEQMTDCLVGEPTCPELMGEMMKIGRRGSMNATFEINGIQGHSAYPHRACNPLTAMAALTHRLTTHVLDQGTDHFDPSTLALTSVDTGNPATNVIPARCTVRANLRFNDIHTGASLTAWLEQIAAEASATNGSEIQVSVRVSGEAFLTPPGRLSDLVSEAIAAQTGRNAQLSTSGGTSDARFIKSHCPVVEFGLIGKTMHQVDEHVDVSHVQQLKEIYARLIRSYFA